MPWPTGASPAPAPVRVDAAELLPPMQALALAAVEEEPGCSIARVAERLRSSHTTASYHLFTLARIGLVSQVRDGREVRHFPGAGRPAAEAYVRALLRDERKRAVLEILASGRAEPRAIHPMAREAGLSFSYLKRTLQQLESAGIVLLERGRYRYAVRLEPGVRPHLEGLLTERAAASTGPLGDGQDPGALPARRLP